MAYKDLYFIPILARAFQASAGLNAWKEALTEIELLGRQPEYQTGYRQYQRFMEIAVQHLPLKENHAEKEMQELIRDLMIELATNSFIGDEDERQAALNLIASKPEWQEEYVRLYTDMNESIALPTTFAIQVEKNGKPFGSIQLQTAAPFGSIDQVDPGFYRLKLESGQVLWEGELTAKELIWNRAFPGRPLKMAAMTETGERAVTREEYLLDGELILQVTPGIENGVIKIQLRLKK